MMPPTPICDPEVVTPGVVTSPGYPADYSASALYCYTAEAPQGQGVSTT